MNLMVLTPQIGGPKTAVVLGTYRSGTSMIAKILYDMNVPMGIDYDPSEAEDYCNYEDYLMAAALNARDWPAVERLIAERDVLELWGFKWPGTVWILPELLPRLRNPHLIVVLRDPLSAWQSDRAHGGRITLADALGHMAAVQAVVKNPPCPCAAVSFERARGAVEMVARQTVEFLKIPRFES